MALSVFFMLSIVMFVCFMYECDLYDFCSSFLLLRLHALSASKHVTLTKERINFLMLPREHILSIMNIDLRL